MSNIPQPADGTINQPMVTQNTDTFGLGTNLDATMNNDKKPIDRSIVFQDDSSLHPAPINMGARNRLNGQPEDQNMLGGPSLNVSQPFRSNLLMDTQQSDQFFDQQASDGRQGGMQAGLGSLLIGGNHQPRPMPSIMQPQVSVSSNTSPTPVKVANINVMLILNNTKMKINNAPLMYKDNDPSTEEIQVLPILRYIDKKGQKIEGKVTQLIKQEDDPSGEPMLVFIGIISSNDPQKTTIGEDNFVSLDDLETIKNKLYITLQVEAEEERVTPAGSIRQQQTNMPQPPLADQVATKNEQPVIQVSVPQMNTESQFANAVEKTIKPIDRVRATKAQIAARKGMQDGEEEEKKSEDSSNNVKPDDNNGVQASGSDSNFQLEDLIENHSVENDSEDEENEDSYQQKKEKKKIKQREDLMKPTKFGVNHGKTKDQVNAEALNTSKKTVQVKGGEIKPDQRSNRRTKERSITEIIEKVSTWRKLYNGVMVEGTDGRQQLQRWSLEDAAEKVGVSKKSLDDYLLQLRFGKKFGFDFETNRNNKVGVLRTFVKEKKREKKQMEEAEKKGSGSAQTSTRYQRKGKK